jgi:hypothetical protein
MTRSGAFPDLLQKIAMDGFDEKTTSKAIVENAGELFETVDAVCQAGVARPEIMKEPVHPESDSLYIGEIDQTSKLEMFAEILRISMDVSRDFSKFRDGAGGAIDGEGGEVLEGAAERAPGDSGDGPGESRPGHGAVDSPEPGRKTKKKKQ